MNKQASGMLFSKACYIEQKKVFYSFKNISDLFLLSHYTKLPIGKH